MFCRCPICLAEYADAEVLRKLPLCGHVFHIRCVDSWLENQVTCPVCRIVLTGAVFSHNSKLVSRVQRATTTTTQVPAWVLVNRPLPLPSAIAEEPRSSDSGVSPLLEHQCTGWGAVYLENANAAMAIQSKECIHNASISERWMTESFVFGMSSSSGSEAVNQSPRRHASWIMDLKQQPMQQQQQQQQQQQLQQQLQMMDLEWEHCADDVLETSSRVTPFRPLTMSPERCSFEFLPIVTGPAPMAILMIPLSTPTADPTPPCQALLVRAFPQVTAILKFFVLKMKLSI